MKKLILIALIVKTMLMPLMVSGQNQISRPVKKKIEQTSGNKSNKTTPKKSTQAKTSNPDGYINGHGYVDLGLPSGTKWATCNIGASQPSDHGDYFAWGETLVKNEYTASNSITDKKPLKALQAEGIINESNILNKTYDVANVKWGEEWRMPVLQDFEELIDYCSFIWEPQGFVVKGPNGKSIYIPNAGYHYEDYHFYSGSIGHYWSASACDSNEYAFELYLNGNEEIYESSRLRGCSIRPIYQE